MVLDLDETLVYTEPIYGEFQQVPGERYYFDGSTVYRIKLRPHFHHFLIQAALLYDIGVWTASENNYAINVCQCFPEEALPVLVYTEKRCVKKHTTMVSEFDYGITIIKPLEKIWRRKKWSKFDTVVVDNTPSTYSRNYGNAIRAVDYTGQEDDDDLFRILDVLRRIADEPNVREGLRKARQN